MSETKGGQDKTFLVRVIRSMLFGMALGSLFFFVALRGAIITFDSDLMPDVNGLNIGDNSSARFARINDTVYFSGSALGVGILSPSQKLEVDGGVRFSTTDPKPVLTCADGSLRGTFWVTQSGTSTKDKVEVCANDFGGNADWRTIY